MKLQEKDLLELKEKIEAAKNEVERLRGRKQQLFDQLKKEYKLDSIEAAKEQLLTYEDNIKELNTKIDKSMQMIEEKMKNI